ncbi:hypothetical protein MCOR27_011531 [Pyricularia oryzae]|nr:hypothetical protein MCOR34_011908 [Pyricularia oryzae]KAI6265080.1 hypothetical protein MCOR27_011531 [Pyricularia oryzae]KAI6273676.1 hypothetical protein MCOR26_006815 [Pyricularia oryzae]KAI6325566.1 hypothetical protein MCOR29_003697 [Pyricularia oryzae]KAI6351747.1 hypothetical protein MCOR32_011554 [Pyricularia oryzae]
MEEQTECTPPPSSPVPQTSPRWRFPTQKFTTRQALDVPNANNLEARATAFPNPFKRCDKKKFNACTAKCHENRNCLGGNLDIGCISACVAANPKMQVEGEEVRQGKVQHLGSKCYENRNGVGGNVDIGCIKFSA